MRFWRAAAVLVALAAGAPSTAIAAPGLEVGIEDEGIMLGEFGRAPDAVAAWRDLGVEVVRVHARWGKLAPAPHAARRPAGFDAGNPDDRHYDWTELDRAVGLLRSGGLKIALTVTGPGPLWTSRKPSLRKPTYKPDPRAFGLFARAVARRYRGQIERYLVWNEPNIPGWLSPQLSCSRPRVCTPVAPHLYRGLVRAAVPAIKAADPRAKVLIGELAPIGRRPLSDLTTIPPLTFFRAMGCVDERYKPVRSGMCAGFKPAAADGIGHHPHPVLQAPDEPSVDKNWAKMGDLPRLIKVLDRLTRAGRMRAPNGRFDLWLTEFGYQTSPPDHASGIPVSRQALWLQQAAYLSWLNPRVRSLTFYQWADEPVRYRGSGTLSYAGWQSGLLYVNGHAKPALQGFATPLVVDRRPGSSSAVAWGQIRAGGVHSVTLEQRGPSGFVPLATLNTDARGYWSRRIDVVPGDELRFTWSEPAAPETRLESGTAVIAAGSRARLSAAR